MNITRLTELSLFYAIQNALAVKKTGEQPTSADFKTYTLKYTTIQPQYPVVVYLNGVVQASGYTVNYEQGIITFSTSQSGKVVTVDYYYCPVNMYDEGKSPTDDDFHYPAVAVYNPFRDDVPFELGNSMLEVHATWVIEVWADRGGERNDYSDTITDLFQSTLPVIDYNQGFPLNPDGTLNTAFTAPVNCYMIRDSINSRKGGSLDIGEKPKYMSEITVELIINR